MKVFLSWSGTRSQRVAATLRDWLPNVLQAVSPWLSSSDIQIGTRWANELDLQLQESRVGIICLTPENLAAPWLLYEAGALSKAIESAFVCPYLFGFQPSELTGPLVQFQATTATRDGTLALVRMLNRALGNQALDEKVLERAFQLWWPSLSAELTEIAESSVPPKKPEAKSQADATGLAELAGKLPPAEAIELLNQVVSRLTGSSAYAQPPQSQRPTERVFIVHGHNDAIKESVARFVEKLGLAAIVLHELPNEGKTIIEKFESHSQVDYAVVLLTADDEGSVKRGTGASEKSPRARQNVVFELGFFSAKLGRSRVAVLYEQGVEIPSDFSGILYIPIDQSGVWRFQLAKELKTAGLRVDLNAAL
jgi:predicted nucleotide-binding protein